MGADSLLPWSRCEAMRIQKKRNASQGQTDRIQEHMQTMDREEVTAGNYGSMDRKRRLVSQAKIDSQSPSIITKQTFTSRREYRVAILNAG